MSRIPLFARVLPRLRGHPCIGGSLACENAEALHYNALVVLLAPVLLAYFAIAYWKARRDEVFICLAFRRWG